MTQGPVGPMRVTLRLKQRKGQRDRQHPTDSCRAKTIFGRRSVSPAIGMPLRNVLATSSPTPLYTFIHPYYTLISVPTYPIYMPLRDVPATSWHTHYSTHPIYGYMPLLLLVQAASCRLAESTQKRIRNDADTQMSCCASNAQLRPASGWSINFLGL